MSHHARARLAPRPRLLSWLALTLCLTLVARGAAAQSALVDLGQLLEPGPWRVHHADRGEFASPSFDDRAWERRSLAQWSAERDPWTWLRAEVELPAELARASGEQGFALTFRAYFPVEVFANGERVFSRPGFGSESADGTWYAPVVVRLPRGVVRGGRVLIALRTWRPPRVMPRTSWRAIEHVYLALTPLAQAHADHARRERWWATNATSGALGVLLFIVAAAHLALYLRRRELQGYLWYSLFVFVAFLWEVVAIAASNAWVAVLRADAIAVGLTYLMDVLWGEFVLRFVCARRPGRLWAAVRAALLGAAAWVVLGGPRAQLVLPLQVTTVVWLSTVFALAALIVREVVRGNRAARTAFIGLLLGVACFTVGTLTVMGILPAAPVNISQFGALPVIGSMGIALLQHFARALDETRVAALRFVPFEFLALLGRAEIRGINRGEAVEREVSVMFADIRGFTTRVEGLTPAQSFAFVNEYLHAIEPSVRRRGGYVHQYMGDGIVAMFPGPADDALRAAVEMQETLRGFARTHGPLDVGIGLHRGRVTLGIIGGLEQLDAGVIGDAMNLASRVEGMTKLYGAKVLASAALVGALQSRERFALREVDRVIARGRAEPTTLYESLDALDPEPRAVRLRLAPEFGAALAAYRRGDLEAAARGFGDVLARDPGDGAAKTLLARSRAALRSGLPEGWDGTYALESK